MSLDIKKVYVDTRWKTADSKSDCDFSIELPRSFTVPDNVVAYIDDIVLPISFPTVYDRNNTLYFQWQRYTAAPITDTIVLDTGNYNGQSFSAALKTKLNEWAASRFIDPPAPFDVIYDLNNNTIKITNDLNFATFRIFTDDELKNGSSAFPKISDPKTLNKVLMLYKPTYILKSSPLETFLDLHTTRNLYLTSSALGSYNSISNFGNDTIIKKIPVKAGFNEMLYHDSGSGFDYLDVTPRTLRYIDFKLVNAYFDTVDLRGNHWSFSIIFAQK